MRAGAALALGLAVAGCGQPALDSCADPLGGTWDVVGELAPSGEPRRYHALDLGATIEMYPMFDDGLVDAADRKDTTPTAIVAAPAALDLSRTTGQDALGGQITRRFMRGDRSCVMRAPAHLRACSDDRATLEAALLAPPTNWQTCTGAPPTVVRWQLTRGP